MARYNPVLHVSLSTPNQTLTFDGRHCTDARERSQNGICKGCLERPQESSMALANFKSTTQSAHMCVNNKGFRGPAFARNNS